MSVVAPFAGMALASRLGHLFGNDGAGVLALGFCFAAFLGLLAAIVAVVRRERSSWLTILGFVINVPLVVVVIYYSLPGHDLFIVGH